jgi:hypothetical protein
MGNGRATALTGRSSTEEPSGQPRHVEQLVPTGIHEREEVEVEVALRPLSRAVLDAQLLERLCHSCATIAITRDVADAVRPEHLDELSHHALRGFYSPLRRRDGPRRTRR